jgi:hypothetical protein
MRHEHGMSSKMEIAIEPAQLFGSQALELVSAGGFFCSWPHNVYSIEFDIQQISAKPL